VHCFTQLFPVKKLETFVEDVFRQWTLWAKTADFGLGLLHLWKPRMRLRSAMPTPGEAEPVRQEHSGWLAH
jgi:hypothetical protein